MSPTVWSYIHNNNSRGNSTYNPDKKALVWTLQGVEFFYVFSARCNICISRLCYDVTDVSVRLSVTEVHCGHGACREEGRSHLALY